MKTLGYAAEKTVLVAGTCERRWSRSPLLVMLALLLASIASTALAGPERAAKPPGKPLLHPRSSGVAATEPVPGALRHNAGFAAYALQANDDESSGLVPMGFGVSFGGLEQTALYVNNNGNVTFGSSLWDYTPYSLGSSTVPLIAPFFADVDTRPAGSAVVTYGNDTVAGHAAFGVTYRNVGYYNSHVDKLNSFQLVLIERSDIAPGDFDIEFNYDSIAWETGDASGGQDGFGGTAARAGFNDGTGSLNGWLELAGSGSSGALIDGGVNALSAGSLDSAQVGRYVFRIRSQSSASLSLLDENDANRGVAVSGAAADGATQVRVRCVSPTPGVVSLVYDGGLPSNTPPGTLVPAPGSIGGLSNLTLQPVGGEYQADAIYTVPEGLVGEITHEVFFRGVYSPESGGPQTLEPQTLQLRRPPVILVHGLGSLEGGRFRGSPLRLP